MRWRSRSAMVWVMPSASRRSRKHCASRSVNRIERSAAPSNSAPPFDVIAPPSKAPTSLRPPQLPKSSSSWLQCVGIGEHLLFSRSRCSTTSSLSRSPEAPHIWEKVRLSASDFQIISSWDLSSAAVRLFGDGYTDYVLPIQRLDTSNQALV